MKVITPLLPSICLLAIAFPFFSASMDCIDFFAVLNHQKKINTTHPQEANSKKKTKPLDLQDPDETHSTQKSCLCSWLCRDNDDNSATDLEKGNLGTLVAKSATMNSGEKS